LLSTTTNNYSKTASQSKSFSTSMTQDWRSRLKNTKISKHHGFLVSYDFWTFSSGFVFSFVDARDFVASSQNAGSPVLAYFIFTTKTTSLDIKVSGHTIPVTPQQWRGLGTQASQSARYAFLSAPA
jgi:hypothetical protein